MGSLRLVQPAIVRVPLPEGDWIDIKRELTAGEEREVYARMTKSLEAGERPQLDVAQVQLAIIVAYLHGWSLMNGDGHAVPVSESAIKQLAPDSFKAIHDAITAHEAALAGKNAEPGRRERIVSDLWIARRMNWTYADVLDLPADVYQILVEELRRELDAEAR